MTATAFVMSNVVKLSIIRFEGEGEVDAAAFADSVDDSADDTKFVLESEAASSEVTNVGNDSVALIVVSEFPNVVTSPGSTEVPWVTFPTVVISV